MFVGMQTLVNVVSVGDSVYEMEAAEQASRRFDRRLVKTIRLREKPRGEQLCKQLKLVSSKLSEVFGSHKSLTIKLQPKQ
jgi:phosphoglycolate phosphatase-like HAD superfamily hydrolase